MRQRSVESANISWFDRPFLVAAFVQNFIFSHGNLQIQRTWQTGVR